MTWKEYWNRGTESLRVAIFSVAVPQECIRVIDRGHRFGKEYAEVMVINGEEEYGPYDMVSGLLWTPRQAPSCFCVMQK